jgi:Uma2 family endonuclease
MHEIPDNLFRLSVEQYHRLIESGALAEDDNVELLEGLLVQKTSKNPPHSGTITRLNVRLSALLSAAWTIRTQDPLTLDESQPEPDVAVVEKDTYDYTRRNPSAADVALVIEVADSSLVADRVTKKRICARAGIPQYWIVNLGDGTLEVYTEPNGTAAPPDYATRRVYTAGEVVELFLRGSKLGDIAVSDVLPPV